MSLFKATVEQAVNNVDYHYMGNDYVIDHTNLLLLIESVVLAAIYNKDILEEVYKQNN